MALIEDTDDFVYGLTTGERGEVELFEFSFGERFSFASSATFITLKRGRER